MSNTDILYRPDVIAALQTWWDERRMWMQGTSSAVIADMLEEYGWDGPGLLTWMRRADGAGYIDPDDGIFSKPAGVFQVSAGTSGNQILRHAVGWLVSHIRGFADWRAITLYSRVCVSPETVKFLALTRECRNHVLYSTLQERQMTLLTYDGLSDTMYGLRFVLNESQPPWLMTLNYLDELYDARVW